MIFLRSVFGRLGLFGRVVGPKGVWFCQPPAPRGRRVARDNQEATSSRFDFGLCAWLDSQFPLRLFLLRECPLSWGSARITPLAFNRVWNIDLFSWSGLAGYVRCVPPVGSKTTGGASKDIVHPSCTYGSILAPTWACLGVIMGSSWSPNEFQNHFL